MPGSLTARIVVLATFVAAVVGAVDALIARDGDLVVVFVVVAVLQFGLFVGTLAGSRLVPVRHDLASWLDEQSATTGEPVHRIADRCIADRRAALRRKG